MKHFVKTLLLVFIPVLTQAQSLNVDSLKNILVNSKDAPQRYTAALFLNVLFQETNRDTALYYANQDLLIATHENNNIGKGVALCNRAYQLMNLGKYANALSDLQQAFIIAENADNEKQTQWQYFPTKFAGNQRLILLSFAHHNYALLMLNTENNVEAIQHFKQAAAIAKDIDYKPRLMIAYLNIGETYNNENKPDSALHFERNAEQVYKQIDTIVSPIAPQFLSAIYLQLGNTYSALKNDSMSLVYYYKSIQWSFIKDTRTILSRAYLKLCNHYIKAENKDSSLYYAKNNFDILQTLRTVTNAEINMGLCYKNLYLSYELNHQFDSAFNYLALAFTTTDSLNKEKIKHLADFQTLTYSEQLRLQKLEQEKEKTQSEILTYSLIAGLCIFLLIGLIIYRNSIQRKKANIILLEQKVKVENALIELKSTQQQLIQSEKMASLGELTAGIAHEIQNPLNFVNNFSEVNKELIDELRIKNEKLKIEDDEINDLLNDLADNEEKINHHGKRADAIVKGMLQHSKKTSGQKEPTDINALADEYLRLSYHGMRAKDKNFNATINTDFDEAIGLINIIPQDISRVLLNLYNNAFYAVNELSNSLKGEQYQPTVSVTTKMIENSVTITVSDNGNGIPQNIVDKIFQPFFTTKPTGQGTGLGLSLSYDIIKAHGGKIKVESPPAGEAGEEGEGSKFTIQLPII